MAEKKDRGRRKEKARRIAERAKQRYKDLAIFGTITIGGIVAFHYGESGYGSAFTFAAAMSAMVITGLVFGIVALAIRIDHRRRQ
jgi:ABC-type uncharacterized transport system permease subunit